MSTPGLRIRPLTAADRDALADAFARLSPESRHRRFLAPKTQLSPRELTYLTDIDHVTHEALAALDDRGRILGVARYAAVPGDPATVDFAVAVVDDWQRRGIGRELSEQVLIRAAENGYRRVTGQTFWDNRPARRLIASLGFRARGSSGGLIDVELRLVPAGARVGAQAS